MPLPRCAAHREIYCIDIVLTRLFSLAERSIGGCMPTVRISSRVERGLGCSRTAARLGCDQRTRGVRGVHGLTFPVSVCEKPLGGCGPGAFVHPLRKSHQHDGAGFARSETALLEKLAAGVTRKPRRA